MLASDAIAQTLIEGGVRVVFGVVGSGNFFFTNSLRDGGATFYAARHESNATSMADGYARACGEIAAVSVHQGPGFTNTLTHLTEAAKSRTPLILLAADTPATTLWSNFKIDQAMMGRETGAIVERVRTAETAGEDAARALRRARCERRPVLLNVPEDIVMSPGASVGCGARPVPRRPVPSPQEVAELTDLIAEARRPVIIAGRGSALAGARDSLQQLGERIGAALATSGGAHGLFAGDPHSIGISGGFSSPLAAEILAQADLILAFGASLNHWTAHNGLRFSAEARIVQVDLEDNALGALHRLDLGVVADADAAAQALLAELVERGVSGGGFRSDGLAAAVEKRRWRDELFEDESTSERIDPRSLTIALDDRLPAERTVATDGGHFLGYPSMYLRLPDEQGFVFPQAFQGIGQGLGAAIGAAIARPDRVAVAALGDGGALMALSDLETAVRYELPMIVLVYNDAAYGAEVHHFEPMGHNTDIVRFPDTDFAAIGHGIGADAVTVRRVEDLDAVTTWLDSRERPLVIDAKLNPEVRAEWLQEAFGNH